MAETNLTQAEADTLLQMEKVRIDDKEHLLPSWDLGGKISVPLTSLDKRENFLLDVSRRNIHLAQQSIQKQTYQNRARDVVILARFDFGQPHRNPPELGGAEVGVPHLHLYVAGYADKYAIDVPKEHFSDLDDPKQILHDFMEYCNITQPPYFRKDLFT